MITKNEKKREIQKIQNDRKKLKNRRHTMGVIQHDKENINENIDK